MAQQNSSKDLGKNQNQSGRGVNTPNTTGAGETSTNQRQGQNQWSSEGMKQPSQSQTKQTRNIDK